MINNNELQRKVAFLESKLDHLESEVSYLNTLLVDCGFPDGIQSLKVTIEELLAESSLEDSSELDF